MSDAQVPEAVPVGDGPHVVPRPIRHSHMQIRFIVHAGRVVYEDFHNQGGGDAKFYITPRLVSIVEDAQNYVDLMWQFQRH